MSEANKAVITRLVSEVLNDGNLEVINELFAPEAVEEASAWIAPFRHSFPDVRMDILDLIAEGDRVVGRFACSATHTQPWLGYPPTGRRFENVAEISVYRFENGRIAQTWTVEDNLDRLTQLGLIAGG